jgi:hypothetical protein
MIFACFLAIAISTTQGARRQDATAEHLARLGRARMAFEKKVDDHSTEDEFDQDHIYSMGPGGQEIFGYYPIGRSDRRYLAVTVDEWVALIFQRIEGKHAKRIWRLTLTKATGTPKYTGTLARVLLRHGFMVTGFVPRSARHDLNKTFRLAGYGFDGIGDLSAWTINADGSLGPVYDNVEPPENSYPIVAEESIGLGFGNVSLPPNLKERSSSPARLGK